MIKEILSSGEGGKTPGSKIASPLLYYFTLQFLPYLQSALRSAFFFQHLIPLLSHSVTSGIHQPPFISVPQSGLQTSFFVSY